jgi:hypothetical protein
MNGQSTPMPQAPIAANLDEPLDVQVHFSTQVTFDREVLIDVVADSSNLMLGQIFHPSFPGDAHCICDLFCPSAANAVHVGKGDLHLFVVWDINPTDARHARSL